MPTRQVLWKTLGGVYMPENELIIIDEFHNDIQCKNCKCWMSGDVLVGYTGEIQDKGLTLALRPFSIACLNCDGLIKIIRFDKPFNIDGDKELA